MLTYILPLEGGGVCVSVSWFIYFFTEGEEAAIECWWVLPWNALRHNKTGLSFNPGAATDNSGSVKTCLCLDDWQEGCPEIQSWQSSFLLPPHCALLRYTNKN